VRTSTPPPSSLTTTRPSSSASPAPPSTAGSTRFPRSRTSPPTSTPTSTSTPPGAASSRRSPTTTGASRTPPWTRWLSTPTRSGRHPCPPAASSPRDPETLDALAIATPYLESDTQPTLGGTRSGAGVAGAHTALSELWPEGYREQYDRSQANADYLAAELSARGYDVVDPELPLVAADLPDDEFRALRDRGWRISRTASDALRVVCMPHVTREMLDAFLVDVDAVA